MGVPRQVQSPLLVGRDDVLQLAERRVAEASAGRGGSLLLAGEAGIGKSRLIDSIVRLAAAAGFRHAKGDLSPHDRLVPLASILDLARTMTRIEAFGTLGDALLAMGPGREADPLGHRRLLVHDVADRLLDAVDGRTLLAFDDLQWADELSLEVIGELARRARDRPLLIVGGYRPADLGAGSPHREWRSRLLAQRIAEEIRLVPLDREQTALVTTLILNTGLPAPRDVASAVFERTDGIPLHVEELLAVLDDEARMDGARIREAHVPDTIEDTVLARYRRLSAEAQAVARAGAVVGRCFVPDVVAGLLDRPVADLDAPFAELVDEAFLYPFNFLDRGYYDFRHQLLRDALYGTVQAAELRRLHARAAEFGGLNDGPSEAHTSLHFERAGLRTQAYRSALTGARAAAALSSRREAYALYGRAVANAPTDLSARELGDLYLGYADAAGAVDDSPVMRGAALRAREHYLAAGEPLLAAEMLLLVTNATHREAASFDDRDAVLAAAEAEIEAQPESGERHLVACDGHLYRAIWELDRSRLDAGQAWLDRCDADLVAAARDPDAAAMIPVYRADLAFWQAHLDVLRGDVDAGLRSTLAVARDARARSFESTGVTAFRNIAMLGVRVLDYPAARAGLEEGLRYADEIEQSYCRHAMASMTAQLLWAEGRWSEAKATAEIELVEPGSLRSTLPAVDALAFVAVGRGELEQARTLLGRSLAEGIRSDSVLLTMPARWGIAELALLEGDAARAVDECRAAADLAAATDERPLLIPFVVTGTRAALAARRPEVAEAWLDEMRTLLAAWPRQAAPALAHAEGLLRTSAGSTILARAALQEAVDGWERLGRSWERRWAELDLAACLLRANREADALPLLLATREAGVALASRPIVERADELIAVARARGAEEEPWRPLTAREFEVARYIADGMTNAQIADRLRLSPRTVGAHVEHILAKLDVARRAEIASWVAGVRPVAGQPVAATRD